MTGSTAAGSTSPTAGLPAGATARRQHVAGAVALAGGTLGITAGAVQATAGRHIPDWTGHKNDPVTLGLLTVALSLLTVVVAVRLRRPTATAAGMVAAIATEMTVTGAVGFTTVGRLWYLPGPLLLAAAGLAVATGPPRDVAAAVRAGWMRALVSMLGICYLLLSGVASAPAATLAGLGGFAVFAAPWVAKKFPRWAVVLLVGGAVPFAVATWWSLITPALAVLVVGLGIPVVARSWAR